MKIVGLDLGTANTYIYVAGNSHLSAGKEDLPRALVLPRISDSTGSIATVVMYEKNVPTLVGNIAESEYYANSGTDKRRRLASQFKPEIAGDEPSALRAMQDFLTLLREAIPADVFEPDTRLYVGMPSLSREDFSINLGICLEKAGWPKAEFLRESDAALISCLQSEVLGIDDIDRKCLILDFGGGTCDYTLVENLDALRNGGDLLYGGRLFDDLFFQVFCRCDGMFAKEVPASPYAWYIHWIECKNLKEQFSDFLNSAGAVDDNASMTLHATWYDSAGERRDTFVPSYTGRDFIRDAENYKASPQMLSMLASYNDRGGISEMARDLLAGRKVGLLSWLRMLLESIGHRPDVRKVVLTGGSSRWFFVSRIVGDLFKSATCVHSSRGYEDIAFGLALYPALLASREKTETLINKNLEGFTAHVVKKARELMQRQISDVTKLCCERIINRDILPVLECAQKKPLTVAEAEKQFAENMASDIGLREIVEERSKALGREIQDELNFSFRRWLRENGVLLAPSFVFPANSISHEFFTGLSLNITNIDTVKMAAFIVARILPILTGLTVGGAIAHSGEPVTTVLGGGVAFGATWIAARMAPKVLRNVKLSAFFLTEKMRGKIIRANRDEIEKTLRKAFGKAQKDLERDIEYKLRNSLEHMVGQLGILNQIKTRAS